jgi:tRNA pseudouridine55 synthase
MQRPPAFSAVKVRGERAYRRARRGEQVETAERPVTVHRFEELWREGERVGLEIECSSGTYVRSLVADLGDAYCEELERIAIGPFLLENADPERVLPLSEALRFMPERRLDEQEAEAVGHGRRVAAEVDGPVRLMLGGEVVAIAEPRGGELQPVVVFAAR